MPHERFLLALVLWIALGALCIALVSQHVFDMQPCAWCVLQRMILLAIAVAALLGWFGARRSAAFFILVTASAGALAAWHQLTVAAKLFSCDQTLADRIVSASGLDATFPWLFGIYATCMDAAVSILGLDYAAWGLGLFAMIVTVAVAALRVSYRWQRNQG